MPVPTDLSSVKGFLSEEEGEKLYSLALESSKKGPILELGSYCGKSTIYIGSAVKDNNSLLYAVDHHRGSEEHQVGEEYHDPDLYDAAADAVARELGLAYCGIKRDGWEILEYKLINGLY